MTAEELRAAASKVQRYMYARSLTTGAVLAAYLRRDGLPVYGAAYQCAKAALDAGQSFEEAVASARALTGNGRTPQPAHRDRPAQPAASIQPVVKSSVHPVKVPLSNTTATTAHWDWYPKPYGPGDIDGAGALNLLGAPSVGLSDLLLRETAQNSWDAKLANTDLRFGMHLRTLTEEQRDLLTQSVFRAGSAHLPLAESLRKEVLRGLEITDRGTTGLDGPTRTDLPIPGGSSRNYIDLILNVGAPPDRLGAGTYGFGKTAAYAASNARTVIFWSRSLEGSIIEDRLIASAIGTHFDMNQRRYTGRHWWGHILDGRIEPLRADAARDLAHRLFSCRYEPGETGTSMLILDPQLGETDAVGYMNSVRDAVLYHLWPKLVPSDGARRMTIELQLDSEWIEIPDPTTVPALAPFVECLRAVRSTQSGEGIDPDMPIRIEEISSQRPPAPVGHLALARRPIPNHGHYLAGLPKAAHHVCLMRNEAELVVTYKEFVVSDVDGFQWAGVFKPVAEMDEHFAKAEPPAHDEWQPARLPRPGHTYVNKAMTRIRELVRDFLRPVDAEIQAPRVTQSAAVLADRLAGLVGSAQGTRPTLAASISRSNQAQGRKPRALVTKYVDLTFNGKWRRVAACVELDPRSPGPAWVTGAASIGIEGGLREVNDHLVRLIGWSDEAGGTPFDEGETCALLPGASVWLQIEARSDLVVDVQLKAEVQ